MRLMPLLSLGSMLGLALSATSGWAQTPAPTAVPSEPLAVTAKPIDPIVAPIQRIRPPVPKLDPRLDQKPATESKGLRGKTTAAKAPTVKRAVPKATGQIAGQPAIAPQPGATKAPAPRLVAPATAAKAKVPAVTPTSSATASTAPTPAPKQTLGAPVVTKKAVKPTPAPGTLAKQPSTTTAQ